MQKIVDPALLGESIRAAAEYLQHTGEYEKLLKEAKGNELMPIFEQNLVRYIELIIDQDKEEN